MKQQEVRDAELVRALIPHWYAVRRWAEELLSQAARCVPGAQDVGFNTMSPDARRLKMFAERQLGAGYLSPEYAPLVDDDLRFARAAERVLAEREAGHA